MNFKIHPKVKLINVAIAVLMLIIILYNQWYYLYPFLILYIIILVNMIRDVWGYKIDNNNLVLNFKKKPRIIPIAEIDKILIIDNYTPSRKGVRGGIGKSYYLIVKKDKITLYTNYKNDSNLNIIQYLKEKFDIRVIKDVNISNTYK